MTMTMHHVIMMLVHRSSTRWWRWHTRKFLLGAKIFSAAWNFFRRDDKIFKIFCCAWKIYRKIFVLTKNFWNFLLRVKNFQKNFRHDEKFFARAKKFRVRSRQVARLTRSCHAAARKLWKVFADPRKVCALKKTFFQLFSFFQKKGAERENPEIFASGRKRLRGRKIQEIRSTPPGKADLQFLKKGGGG